jgi:aminoglycoside phosphotransferase (APT) family kinase protein
MFPSLGAVSGLQRLSGGASQETWAFSIEGPGGPVPLILRRAPHERKSDLAAGLEVEAELLKLAEANGARVPHVRHVLTPEEGCGRGFIMDRLEGETIARKILRDAAFAGARPHLARDCGEALARIHRIEPARLPDGLRKAPASVRLAELNATYERIDRPNPVFALALRWLDQHNPGDPAELSLVHGDFRHGNLMIDPTGVVGVLDWELAHLGDPMEDLGWICVPSWRFGEIEHPVGGFGQREDLFTAYEAAGGGTVDPARVKFWEVFGALQWGLMCSGMAEIYRSGADGSVERAMIGRRASEVEIDLLDYIAPNIVEV